MVEVLSFVLPQSPIYAVLSTLPLPNPSEPLGTTTFVAQNAVHMSLPIIEEIVSLLETHEEETMKKEVEKRRTRLGAGGPEIIRNEVGREIWSASKVSFFKIPFPVPLTYVSPSFHLSTMKFSITLTRRTNYVVSLIRSFCDTNSGICMRFRIPPSSVARNPNFVRTSLSW